MRQIYPNPTKTSYLSIFQPAFVEFLHPSHSQTKLYHMPKPPVIDYLAPMIKYRCLVLIYPFSNSNTFFIIWFVRTSCAISYSIIDLICDSRWLNLLSLGSFTWYMIFFIFWWTSRVHSKHGESALYRLPLVLSVICDIAQIVCSVCLLLSENTKLQLR